MAELRTFRVFIKTSRLDDQLLITCQKQQLDRGTVTTHIRACWESDTQRRTYDSISKAVKDRGDKAINPDNQIYLDAARTVKFGDLARNLNKLDFVNECVDHKLAAARQLLEQKRGEHDQAEAAAKIAARAASVKMDEKNQAAAAVRTLEENARQRARLREELKRKAEAEHLAQDEERQAAAQQARAAAKRARCAKEKEQTERQLAELDAAA